MNKPSDEKDFVAAPAPNEQVLSEAEIESYEFSDADSAALDAASAKLIRDVLGAARNIDS